MDSDTWTEEVVPLRERELVVRRPHDVEKLLDDEIFGREDEFIPYWAELWASGRELAEAISGRALRGARVLELGCGLALPSFAAAMAGGRVVATDWAVEALRLARQNAERNGLSIETAICDWRSPDPVVERGPWDLVLAADVLYEERNVDLLLPLLPRLGREVWLADPGRAQAERFFDAAERDWSIRTTGGVHRMRRR